MGEHVPAAEPARGAEPLLDGKLGMTISGDWQIAEPTKYAPDGNYGFTYIPVNRRGIPRRPGPADGRWR